MSSSKLKSGQNLGDVWDSGKVISGESASIRYDGPELEEGKLYYWKVRLWDGDNRTGRYAEPMAFQVGNSSGQLTTPNRFLLENTSSETLRKLD